MGILRLLGGNRKLWCNCTENHRSTALAVCSNYISYRGSSSAAHLMSVDSYNFQVPRWKVGGEILVSFTLSLQITCIRPQAADDKSITNALLNARMLLNLPIDFHFLRIALLASPLLVMLKLSAQNKYILCAKWNVGRCTQRRPRFYQSVYRRAFAFVMIVIVC